MRWKSCLFVLLVLPSILHISASPTNAQDWTAFRGADGTGAMKANSVLSRPGPIQLKVRWKRELGSGYSSVVTSGNRIVTMYADAESDYVVCLNKSTGDTVWQVSVGDAFKGENGSFDGPITTPLIHQDRVYAVDPAGKFVCLSLADGSEHWSTHLVDDLKSKKPLYGFATSPVAVGDTVILQTGVKDASIAGFDASTGEVKWSATDDRVGSQTPTVMDFMGKPLVLAAGGKKLCGIDPSNGTVLFEHEHGGGNGSAMVPVVLPGNRVLMTLDDAHSTVVSLRPGDGDKIAVSKEWQNRSIKNTYNVPAISGGILFAYSTRIHTAVDMETGKPLWKSREPGDGFLISIDDHQIVITKKGSLHVGKANAEEYKEVASMELFDDLVWSLPAYSDNAVYLRSLGEIACVELLAGGQVVVESSKSLPAGPELAKAIADIESTTDQAAKAKRVDDYLASVTSFPSVEGELAQFIYRGQGTDVAVASDIFGSRQERKMTRVAGTDLFYYSVKLQADQRANYMFLVDYKPETDPRNDRVTTSSVYAGEMEFAVRLRNEAPLKMSWFGMPAWTSPSYLPEGDGSEVALKGSLEKHEVKSEASGDAKKGESGKDGAKPAMQAQVYLPPQYANQTDKRFRVIYVFAAGGAQKDGMLNAAVDGAFSEEGSSIEPAILVYANLPPGPQAAEMFANQLVPSIDRAYRTIADRKHRATVGFGFTAGSALGIAAGNNDLVGAAAAYSPLMFDAEQAMMGDLLSKLEKPLKLYVEWGRFDMFNPHENWDIRKIGKSLFESCQDIPMAEVSGGMVNDSTDWSSWRNRYDKFLRLGQ